MAGAEKEQTSYGAFERFIYIFFIPTVFAVILSSVLLSFFGYDVFGTAWRFANSIPIVGKAIPDPKPTPSPVKGSLQSGASLEESLQNAKQLLSQKDAQISKLSQSDKTKDEKIKQLQGQIQALQDQLKQKTVSDEEYLNRIKNLASMYAAMNPSKAAPILENLTIPELVLVLSQMTTEQRVGVLEKMNAKIAAQASIQLKDVVTAENLQIAALQSRLQEYDKKISDTEKLNNEQLAQTFAGMSGKNSAAVLDEMLKTNQPKVIAILTVMDSAARSSILSAISDISQQDAAKIAELMSK